MTQQVVETASTEASTAPPGSAPAPSRAAPSALYRYRWPVGALGLLVVSVVIVVWANVRPGYDPYGWLVWGHLTLHLKLDTNGAPSWKPLPFLFTVPYNVAGHYAMWLWMVTAMALTLSGAVFAWRIAFKLTGAAPERRYAAYAAGLLAALFLVTITNYSHYTLSAQSDTMIVSLCLGAIDCHLSGRPRLAFWLWVLAGLGRPEAWPFLGIYALWLWRSRPPYRTMIVGGLALIPLLWFGIPALTSKSPFTAANIAENSPRALHSNKLTREVGRFFGLQAAPVWIAALLATALAVLRRERMTGLLAAGAIGWVLVEIAFVLHGYPGVPRYLFEPAGVAAVLAGVFAGWVIVGLPSAVGSILRRFADARVGGRLAGRLGVWSAAIVLLLLIGSMLPVARSRYRVERIDLAQQRARSKQLGQLSAVVHRLGVPRIWACGQPNIQIGFQSVLAWYMGVNIGELYVSQRAEQLHSRPLVNIYPIENGWKVVPSHLNASSPAYCRRLRLIYSS